MSATTAPRPAAGAARARPAPIEPTADCFALARAHLGFDNPDWCIPRRAVVLSTLEASSRLTSSQVRTMIRTQHPHLTMREHGDTVSFGPEFRAALACLREEARQHGRLVVVGQAWAGSHRLIALLTTRQPSLVTHVLTGVVAGEVLCRVLDDVEDRQVFGDHDEELLRKAWRAAHPVHAYFRRPLLR